MTKEQFATVLENARLWPEQDQEELAELAREIVARRTGVYVLNDDERRAIDEARRSPLASDAEVATLWASRGIE